MMVFAGPFKLCTVIALVTAIRFVVLPSSERLPIA